MSGPIQVDLNGSWRMTIIALGNARVSMKKAGRVAVRAAGNELRKDVRKHSRRRDWTLLQLAAMDHPYARRHGQIQASALGARFQKRPFLVHRRSGSFHDAIKGRKGPNGMISYEVYADNTVPWVRYVILGTRYMLPRDVIWHTAHDPETKKRMMMAVVKYLGKKLRTQAAVRFE